MGCFLQFLKHSNHILATTGKKKAYQLIMCPDAGVHNRFRKDEYNQVKKGYVKFVISLADE